jgi:hypothetical protein
VTTLDETTVDLEALMLDPDLLTDEDAAAQVNEEVELSEEAGTFVHRMVIKFLLFGRELNGRDLYPYQYVLAYRIIESVILNDGAAITALMARQSGKTETVAVVIATLMVLLPRLAKRYPTWFGDFERGLMVGCFAPVEDQAQTLFGRIVGVLTSERAVELMEEPDIDDRADGGGKFLQLVNCRSFVRLQTANPRANIESKTYHIVVIDEAQNCDYTVVRKSIIPMLASTNGTIIRTGTPTTEKGEFYEAIKTNQRQDAKAGRKKQNHFQADYREVMKYNHKYKKHIASQMIAIGKDSDEFQMSYALKWLLERGMFTTEDKMDELGDPSMKIVHEWHKSPCVAGIDIARKQDSTVVTVLWVDWNNPDQFGYYEHRVLNWLEITGTSGRSSMRRSWTSSRTTTSWGSAWTARAWATSSPIGSPVSCRTSR